jgi:sugar phosphate isomerase/epimerase
MLLGLHGAVVPQADLTTGLKAAAEAGFNAYEPEVPKALDVGDDYAKVNDLRTELGLSWLPLNEIEAFTSEPTVEPNIVVGLARQLSVPAITLIPQVKPGEMELEDAARALADLSERAGEVSLLFEMLAFSDRAFHTYRETLELVRAADVKIVLDTFHFLVSGVGPREIADIPKELIGVVHISDSLIQGKPMEELTDDDRVLPGEGELPLREAMDAIRQTGYTAGMSVEVFHPKYAERDPYEVSQEAFQRTQVLLKSSGWSLE